MNVHVDLLGQLYRVKIPLGDEPVEIYVHLGRNEWKILPPNRIWRYGEILKLVNLDRPILDFENWIFVQSPPKNFDPF